MQCVQTELDEWCEVPWINGIYIVAAVATVGGRYLCYYFSWLYLIIFVSVFLCRVVFVFFFFDFRKPSKRNRNSILIGFSNMRLFEYEYEYGLFVDLLWTWRSVHVDSHFDESYRTYASCDILNRLPVFSVSVIMAWTRDHAYNNIWTISWWCTVYSVESIHATQRHNVHTHSWFTHIQTHCQARSDISAVQIFGKIAYEYVCCDLF